MESLLFAVVSLLILLLIVYFLPLGLTIKGKVLIVVASFLIGLFGLFASAVFTLWQTGLLLLIIAGIFSYLITKRETGWLFLNQGNDNVLYEEKFHAVVPGKEINDTYSFIASSDKTPKAGEVRGRVFNLKSNVLSEKSPLKNESTEENTNTPVGEKEDKLESIKLVTKTGDESAGDDSKDSNSLFEESLETSSVELSFADRDLEAMLDDDYTSVQPLPASEEENSLNYMNDLEKMLDIDEPVKLPIDDTKISAASHKKVVNK